MSLRILHSIASVDPATGGPVEGIKQLGQINRSNGHSVDVVCLDDPNSPWLKDFPLTCHALGPGLFHYGYSSRLAPWLHEHRGNYDAVIVNGLWQYSSYAVWRALHGTSTPYFVFPHGMLDPWFKKRFPIKHLKKWLYWPWAEYRVLRDAAAVLFTCEQERRLARRSFWLYDCEECVVKYGTGRPPGIARDQREAFLGRFPRLREKRCLLFLGRVHVKKGADLLLKALAALRAGANAASMNEVHIVMAGPSDHAYGLELKRLVDELGLSDHVTWTGLLTGDLKWGAYRTADAFVLPSHQENFGIAVAEALACGLPVLISNQVNIWHEVATGGAGLVGPDDLAGTTETLRRWIAMPEDLRQQMGRAALQCYQEHFTIEGTGESLLGAMVRHGLVPREGRGEGLQTV